MKCEHCFVEGENYRCVSNSKTNGIKYFCSDECNLKYCAKND